MGFRVISWLFVDRLYMCGLTIHEITRRHTKRFASLIEVQLTTNNGPLTTDHNQPTSGYTFSMPLNAVDLILLALIVFSVVNGWRRGFILGLLDLIGWAICLIAALRFYQPLAAFISKLQLWSDVWDQPVAFILIACITAIAFQFLGHALLDRMPKDIHERSANRLLGTIPGFANGLITAALLSAVLLAIPLNETLRESARSSILVNRLAGHTEKLETALRPVFNEAIAKTLLMLTVQPESNERVNLPYKVPVSQPRADLESRMLQLVNKERVAAGLRPLAPDPEATEVARRHSSDMFARGYFAHEDPEGRDAFDRMRESGVQFQMAGENLALAPTVQLAHTGLMNSPGHRANIMHGGFNRVGIGIMDGGSRGLMVTQNFRN